jgi:hypothetical protein
LNVRAKRQIGGEHLPPHSQNEQQDDLKQQWLAGEFHEFSQVRG